MSMLLTWLDRAALTLTGVGVIGGALAAIDVLPSPAGVSCAAAFGAGVLSCVLVKFLTREMPQVEVEEAAEIDLTFAPHPDPFRIKTVITDPGDPSVPGTVGWMEMHGPKH